MHQICNLAYNNVGSNPTSSSIILRDRAEVARKTHNLQVTGSIPVPATIKLVRSSSVEFHPDKMAVDSPILSAPT